MTKHKKLNNSYNPNVVPLILARIKDEIVVRKLKQSEIARKIGVAPVTLNNWLLAKTIPDAEQYRKLCIAVNVPMYTTESFFETAILTVPYSTKLELENGVLKTFVDNVLHFNKKYILGSINYVDPSNVICSPCFTDAMEGKINKEDLLFIDLSIVDEVKNNQVYILNINNNLCLGQIHTTPRKTMFVQANAKYSSYHLPANYTVIGKVLSVVPKVVYF